MPLPFSITPDDVTQHENWNPDFMANGFDIALVRLPRLVETLMENALAMIVPACLPLPGDTVR